MYNKDTEKTRNSITNLQNIMEPKILIIKQKHEISKFKNSKINFIYFLEANLDCNSKFSLFFTQLRRSNFFHFKHFKGFSSIFARNISNSRQKQNYPVWLKKKK